MSRAVSPPLVDRLPEPEEDAPALSKHHGVTEANRRTVRQLHEEDDLPGWQVIEGDWWEAADDLGPGDRERMTRRERGVFRAVHVHGLRVRDLAEHPNGLDADASTLRSVLRSAEEKRGGQR